MAIEKLSSLKSKATVIDHSVETEQSLIAIVLKEPSYVSLCHYTDFWTETHALIWKATAALEADNVPIDPVLVSNYILEHDFQNLFDFIISIVEVDVPFESAESYAKEIKRHSFNRKLKNLAKEINQFASIGGDPATKIAMTESLLDGINEEFEQDEQPMFLHEAASLSAIDIQEASETGSTGILTGFDSLDELLNGLQPGEMITLAGRPAMGKTSLAMNIAEYVGAAIHQKYAALTETEKQNQLEEIVLVFSLEMTSKDLSKRTVAGMANINTKLMRTGQLSNADWDNFSKAIDELKLVNIMIDQKSGANMQYIRASVRKLSKKYKISMIIIDYLQLIAGDNKKSTYDNVTSNSYQIKKLAKDFKAPVIALSQLSRDVEKRTDKRPVMSDLRESGAIEQDSDIVAFVYRDDYYHPDSPYPGVAEVIIGKNRSGTTGIAMLEFIGASTKFKNLGPDFDLNIMA